MARNGGMSSGTFITNDWRQLGNVTNDPSMWPSALEANANDSIDFSTVSGGDEKNGGTVGQMGGLDGGHSISGNLRMIVHELTQTKMVVYDLQKDRDNLRTAIRKLKVENSRIKAKLKRISEAIKGQTGTTGDKMDVDQMDEDVDYEDLRQFLLVGGVKDPFAIQYNDAPIQDTDDAARTEHKSCERYYWYKMAQFFDDKDAMQKILSAEDSRKAEEVVKAVKNFDQAIWDTKKTKFWETAQRLKFDQHRWIRNLLIKSGSMYIAVASQDKTLGTGWRKQRDEASRTQLWDGENMGGKILMKLRDEFTANHVWQTSNNEEQEALQKFNEFKRTIWKSFSAAARSQGLSSRRSGSRGRGIGRTVPADQPTFPPPLLQSTQGGAGVITSARFGVKPNGKKVRQI